MTSPIVRFFFIAMFLLLLGVVACKKYAQDACLDKAEGDSCEIDRGCNAPADPGKCEEAGANNIMTCIPL